MIKFNTIKTQHELITIVPRKDGDSPVVWDIEIKQDKDVIRLKTLSKHENDARVMARQLCYAIENITGKAWSVVAL